MIHNLNDSPLDWLVDAVMGLLRENPFESASVSNGRVRFIGGLLLIDSGGTLQVVGHLNGDGDFVWSGPWALKGEGEITGDVALTGNLEVLDDGTIKVGNIELRDGKIYVGDMVIDPEDNGGSVIFGDGAKVTANDGAAGVKIESGSGWTAYVAANGIRLGGGVGQASATFLPNLLTLGADRVQVSADELVLAAPVADLEDVSHVLAHTSTGEARWVPVSQLTA